MKNFLTQKNVLITGATAGIGLKLAEELIAYNVNLLLIGRREEKLRGLQSKLQTLTKNSIEIFPLDVSDRQAVTAFTQSLLMHQDVDILVNNAGLALGLEPLDKGSIDQWETMIDTNVKGLLYMTQPIMKQMRERNTGHIVNIGSIAGKTGYPNGNVYCATKSAVHMLGEALNADLFGTQVKVSTIAPGAVETEFSEVRFNGDIKKSDAVYEGYAPLTAEDIASTILNVLNTPPHVSIHHVSIMPTAQRNPYLLHRGDNQ